MHVIPQLRDLESRFADELLVIGVHSAKYTTERDNAHLAAAVARHRIDHPVVNDGNMSVWQQYGVRAWPTLMFVDPEGKVFGRHEGEFALDAMIPVVEGMIAEFDDAGLLDRSPVDAIQHPEPLNSRLAFPAGIDVTSDRLYIADTNHNRIVVTSLEGQIGQIFGSGAAGMDDGPAEQATFNRPHGLHVDGDTVYVADTDNHTIRRIDLASGMVTTVAGTGSQAYQYVSGGPAHETDLNSPWDVVVHAGVLYIAMAGNHQLWAHRIGSDEVRRFAGTGHEGIRDGTLANSWLAQPGGIAVEGDDLVFS
ncbi:MAG TPA: thioredoxin-like domain-containing protein, partial [Thermomicrobiales bacterium]|nr:thioredoxin-like domain-containing protein [Thermomicrobiales bacterium]